MSSVCGQDLGQLKKVAELETSLLVCVEAAVGELQRIECLDEEQRAEIHAILDAMKHDGLSHVAAIHALAEGPSQETYNA